MSIARKIKGKAGFTFSEIIIAVALVSILAVSVGAFHKYSEPISDTKTVVSSKIKAVQQTARTTPPDGYNITPYIQFNGEKIKYTVKDGPTAVTLYEKEMSLSKTGEIKANIDTDDGKLQFTIEGKPTSSTRDPITPTITIKNPLEEIKIRMNSIGVIVDI